MTNLLIRDFVLCNIGIALVSLLLYMAGWSLVNAISIACLAAFALLLIWGGALGFFLSSVSFDFLSRLFRRRGDGRDGEEDERKHPTAKTKEEERKELVNAGKRMIILSLILMGELLLITLAYLAV